jgi:hypothetical protein
MATSPRRRLARIAALVAAVLAAPQSNIGRYSRRYDCGSWAVSSLQRRLGTAQ